MQVTLSDRAMEEFLSLKKDGKVKVIKRINKIIHEIAETPFKGIGKPEPLKYGYAGKWSRRISREDRLIYEVKENQIVIYSLRGHYEK